MTESYKYKFTQEDLKYVQNLFPNMVTVFLEDEDTIMRIKDTPNNEYIDNIQINLSLKFIEEMKNYFSKIGQIDCNNTHTSWWLYLSK